MLANGAELSNTMGIDIANHRSPMMKKSAEVVAAEQAHAAKESELKSANELVKRLHAEVGETYSALRRAMEDADSPLPQCSVISGGEIAYRAVILRKTPGGTLVVRRVGDKLELRFEWSKYNGKFYEITKRSSYSYFDRKKLELADVPEQYLPAEVSA
jgi:hypothetical protein